MKIVPIYGGSIFSINYWNNKVLFIKTALLKNKIIITFVKLVHKSFVSWNKKSSLEYTFKKLKKFKKLETLLPAEVTEAKEIKKL